MLGFSALSEAPLSATAEAELPLVVVPVGAIGASPIGVYAIGQASITTGGTGVSDGDASAALVTVNATSPAPTVSASSVASETGLTITVSAPEATLSVSATASVTIPEITVTAPASTEAGSAISEAQAATIALTPAEAAVTGAAEAVFDDLIEVGVLSPVGSAGIGAFALASSNTVNITSPESLATATVGATLPEISVSPSDPSITLQTIEDRDNARLTTTRQLAGFKDFNYSFYDTPSETDRYQIVNKDLSCALHVTNSIKLNVVELNSDGTVASTLGSSAASPVTLQTSTAWAEYTSAHEITLYACYIASTQQGAELLNYKITVNLLNGTFGSWQQTQEFELGIDPLSLSGVTYENVSRGTAPVKPTATSDYNILFLHFDSIQGRHGLSTVTRAGSVSTTWYPNTVEDQADRNAEFIKYVDGTYTNFAVPVAYQNLTDQFPIVAWGNNAEAGESAVLANQFIDNDPIFDSSQLIETNYFTNELEVLVSSPSASVSGFASVQSNQVTVTSPESSETGTAVAEATIPAINVFTPTARFEGIEIPDALPAITVTSPEAQASVSVTASALSNTVSVSAPELNVIIQTEDTVGDTRRVFITRIIGSQTISLSLPTLPAGSTWGLGPAADNYNYWIDWDKQILAGVYRDGDYVRLGGTLKAGKWSFDNSGNFTLLTSREIATLAKDHGEQGIVGWFGDDTGDAFLDNYDLIIQVPYSYLLTDNDTSTWRQYLLIERVLINFDDQVISTNSSFSGDQFAVGQIGDDIGFDYSQPALFLRDTVNVRDGSGVAAFRPTTGGYANQNLMYWGVRTTLYEGLSTSDYLFRAFESGNYNTSSIAQFDPSVYYQGLPSQTFHDGSQASIDRAAEARLLTNDILVFETEVQIQGNIDGQSYLVPVTSPDASASGLNTTSLPQITVTAPQAIAAGQGSATATAAIPQVTVSSPQSENTISSTAQAVSSTVTVSAPTSFETVVEIPLAKPPVIVSSPEPTASGSGQAESNGVTITVTSPEAVASQGSIASSQLVTVTVSAPDANGSGSSLAQSESKTVTVSAPETTESVVDEPSLPVITISAPEPTISITGDVTTSVVAPVVSIAPAEASVSAGSQADAQSNVIDVQDLVAQATGTALAESASNTVSVTAPEAVASPDTVLVSADLPTITCSAPQTENQISSTGPASLPEVTIEVPEAEAFEYQPDPDRTIIVPLENRALEVESEAGRLSVVEFENRIIVVT